MGTKCVVLFDAMIARLQYVGTYACFFFDGFLTLFCECVVENEYSEHDGCHRGAKAREKFEVNTISSVPHAKSNDSVTIKRVYSWWFPLNVKCKVDGKSAPIQCLISFAGFACLLSTGD